MIQHNHINHEQQILQIKLKPQLQNTKPTNLELLDHHQPHTINLKQIPKQTQTNLINLQHKLHHQHNTKPNQHQKHEHVQTPTTITQILITVTSLTQPSLHVLNPPSHLHTHHKSHCTSTKNTKYYTQNSSPIPITHTTRSNTTYKPHNTNTDMIIIIITSPLTK